MKVYVLTMREEYNGVGFGVGPRVFTKKEDMLKVKEELKDYAIGQFDGEKTEIEDNTEEGYFIISTTKDTYIEICDYKVELE